MSASQDSSTLRLSVGAYIGTALLMAGLIGLALRSTPGHLSVAHSAKASRQETAVSSAREQDVKEKPVTQADDEVTSPPVPPLPAHYVELPDTLVLTALLLDLANDAEFRRTASTKHFIVLNDATPKVAPLMYDCQNKQHWPDELRQYAPELVSAPDGFVPPVLIDLMADLCRRNSNGSMPLKVFNFHGPEIQVEHRSDAVDDFSDYARHVRASLSPEAPKAWVSVWLPGFSKDGRTAVVCFSYEPTAHGSLALYLLRKRPDGKWVVDRRSRFDFL